MSCYFNVFLYVIDVGEEDKEEFPYETYWDIDRITDPMPIAFCMRRSPKRETEVTLIADAVVIVEGYDIDYLDVSEEEGEEFCYSVIRNRKMVQRVF